MDGSGNNTLKNAWEFLDEDAKEILELAYQIELGNGKGRIKTRSLFTAMNSLRLGELDRVLQRIPAAPMPGPVEAKWDGKKRLPGANPALSPCVRGSLSALREVADETGKIRPIDLFVDLGIHGAGSTVAGLKKNGVTPERIRHILKEEGLEVLTR